MKWHVTWKSVVLIAVLVLGLTGCDTSPLEGLCPSPTLDSFSTDDLIGELVERGLTDLGLGA